MLENPVFIIFVVGFIVVIVLASFFNKKALIKRKLKKAVLKHLSDFRDGDVAKVVGTVEITDEALVAPLSNRKCAYYHVLVEQKVSSGKSSHWKKLIEEEVAGKFVIRDGADYACIGRGQLKSYIVQDRNFSSGFMNDASEQLEWYLNHKGYESENMLGFNKTLRYREGILEEGEEIAILGKGVWKSAQSLNLPEAYGRVLEIAEDADIPVYLSDDPSTTKAMVQKTTQKQKLQTGGHVPDNRYFRKTTDSRYFQKK
ncbi:hypothetical protein KDU71_08000 [Carboxylicivirga sediminis]|uniref:RING-type E3 ubiquitin transferase n=1 Tax=Carboxylicivirga sediminis TaxID=2006564 RepID=A0A941IXD8_9BACT|nr:hypothetical protein [Carboxylicivirga sediminis]MBR8535498.1 hypothetical protein [Carboxylicivirga sediminis]